MIIVVIIISEDTKSGYQFYCEFAKLFNDAIQVYHTGYGGHKNAGGASLFYPTVEKLYTDHKIKKGDLVFLAFDNIVATNTASLAEKRHSEEIIDACRLYLTRKNVETKVSEYVCFEQLFLSFEYFWEFCSSTNRVPSTPLETYYCKHKSFFTTWNGNSYPQIFNLYLKQGHTMEQLLSGLAHSISSSGGMTGFKIDKSTIGQCWFADCSVARTKIHKNQRVSCSTCFAIKSVRINNPQAGSNRFLFVVKHSNMAEIAKILHLQYKFI